MKKIFLLILCFHFSFLHAEEYFLRGTIKTYPIVMKITNDNALYSAVYFYTSSKKDIELEGIEGDSSFIFIARKDRFSTDTLEVFNLTRKPSGSWTGTWVNNKGEKYDVQLSPIDISAIKHPYANLPYVQKQKKDDPFSYMRSSEIKIKEGKTVKYGPYSLQYCQIDKTKLESFRIINGFSKPVADKVNNILTSELLDLAQSYYTCSTGDFECHIINQHLTTNVICVTYMLNYFCGGAHPDFGEVALNIDAHTGKELHLEDVLHLVNKPVPAEDSDEWLEYRDKQYAPKLVSLLTRLYPKNMKNEENRECNYSSSDSWNFPAWYFTEKGLYISPSIPHVMAPCRLPEWSVVPYEVLKHYKNPTKNIKLP